MFFRAWVSIIIMVASAIASIKVLNGAVPAYSYAPFSSVLYSASPWILLIVSIKAWHRSFVWRRMLAKRQSSPALTRGDVSARTRPIRVSMLEHFATLFFLVAVAAILRQFSINSIGWWIALIVFLIFFLRKNFSSGGS